MAKYDLATIDQALEDLGHPSEVFDADPYHPDNDAYAVGERRIRAMLVDQANKMRPKAAAAAKLYVDGHNFVQIAKKLNITPNSGRRRCR